MPLSRSFSCQFHAERKVSSNVSTAFQPSSWFCIIGISPYLFNITCATAYNLIIQFNAGSFSKPLISSNTETPRPVPILNTSTFLSVFAPKYGGLQSRVL